MTSRAGPRLIEAIKAIHEAIRAEVVATCARASADELAGGDWEATAGDVIYAVDARRKVVLVRSLRRPRRSSRHVGPGRRGPGARTVAACCRRGRREAPSRCRLVDPIDGSAASWTRNGPARILTGSRPTGRGETLADIAWRFRPRSRWSSSTYRHVWAVRGPRRARRALQSAGLDARALSRCGRRKATTRRARLRRPRQVLLGHARRAGRHRRRGPVRRLLGEGGDDGDPLCVRRRVPVVPAGQLYELAVGHDRWTADLRPLLLAGLAAPPASRADFCAPSLRPVRAS